MRRLHVARVTVDFSDVQEFEPLGKGEYPVVVEKVTYKESQTEDKYDYLNWELTVTEAPNEGRKLWFITSLSPRALFRMKDIFENLGLPSDEVEIDYDEDADNLVIEPELSGIPAIAVVSMRMYEGRPQDNVDTLIAPDKGSGKKVGGRGPVKKTGGAAKKTAGATKKKTAAARRFK
jgi:hypothetical protein